MIGPLIRRVVCNNPGPFTFTGTGTYIIGTGNVAIIDPGPLDDAHLDAIMAALAPDEKVSHIVITHTHLDHSPLAMPLKRAPAQKFMPMRRARLKPLTSRDWEEGLMLISFPMKLSRMAI